MPIGSLIRMIRWLVSKDGHKCVRVSACWHLARRFQHLRPIACCLHSPRDGTPPLGEFTVAVDWAPVLKLSGRMPACGNWTCLSPSLMESCTIKLPRVRCDLPFYLATDAESWISLSSCFLFLGPMSGTGNNKNVVIHLIRGARGWSYGSRICTSIASLQLIGDIGAVIDP